MNTGGEYIFKHPQTSMNSKRIIKNEAVIDQTASSFMNIKAKN
jgi:hypothetical protein